MTSLTVRLSAAQTLWWLPHYLSKVTDLSPRFAPIQVIIVFDLVIPRLHYLKTLIFLNERHNVVKVFAIFKLIVRMVEDICDHQFCGSLFGHIYKLLNGRLRSSIFRWQSISHVSPVGPIWEVQRREDFGNNCENQDIADWADQRDPDLCHLNSHHSSERFLT